MVKIDKEKSSFEFEGYAIGGLKSHTGKFEEFDAEIEKKENKIKSIKGTAKTSSVNTGINALNAHLKSEHFFHSEKYPIIEFKSKKIENNILIGDLTFKGMAREITFPIEISENKISADFKLNLENFNFNPIMAKKEVKIKFNFVF